MGNAQSQDTTSIISEKTTSTASTSIRSTKNVKKPQPYYNAAFIDRHNGPATAHQQVRKPNRPAGHINFFEVAASTRQPARSVHTTSSSASKKSYPSTTTKKLSSTNSSINSQSRASSVSSMTMAEKPDITKDYIVLDNRRYWNSHGSQTFILPCDDDETDRLMTIHYILKSALHGNFISPVHHMLDSHKETKVLDIGCASGTWILEMATEFPNTEFYGIDECPLFPTSIKPANSHFKLHSVLKGLPFKDNEFDFVYMRLMILYFTPDELAFVLGEISRVMKPGGYFEVVDTNYTIKNAGPISQQRVNTELKTILHQHADNASYESNTNHPIFTFLLLAPQDAASSFIAHFTDICQEHTTLPLGGWGGGQIGNLHGNNFKSLLSSIRYKPTTENERHLSPPLTKDMISDILDECEQHQSYLDWFTCYARKPLDEDHLEQSTLDSIYEFVEGFVDG